MVIGAAELAVGGAALTVDGGHNIAGDPASYLIKDAASTHFGDVRPAKVKRRLRVAGYILCLTSLFGVAEAAQDTYQGTHHQAEPEEVGLAIVSMVYGGYAALKLHLNDHDLAHSHGFRHAVSDVMSSGIVVLAAAASSRGVPGSDAVGATLAATATIALNYPTEARLSTNHARPH
jgi:hypothetical protein